MKHFRICVAIYLFIIAGALASYLYTRNEIRQLIASIEKYNTVQTVSENDEITIKSIKNRFFDKKNMLQFFINKEHIHQLETNILLLENSILNNNADECRKNSLEALITLNQINDYTIAVD